MNAIETVFLLVFVSSMFQSMDSNNTLCSEECKGYGIPSIGYSKNVESLDFTVGIQGDSFLQRHLSLFPCPPESWWPSFCSDLTETPQFGVSLSCQDISFILETCLEQQESYVYLLPFCKKYLQCQKFKSLCSSEKYSSYCSDSQKKKSREPSFIDIIRDNGHTSNKHMNNTTEVIMTKSGADSDEYHNEPWNLNVLWALLVLVYILVFVPCFLNFVIKRSLIDKLRNRCQKNRDKKPKTNYEGEPPLIQVMEKEVHTPIGTENIMFLPSRPDSMASSIGEDFDFPFADQSAAVSMVSLLIEEHR